MKEKTILQGCIRCWLLYFKFPSHIEVTGCLATDTVKTPRPMWYTCYIARIHFSWTGCIDWLHQLHPFLTFLLHLGSSSSSSFRLRLSCLSHFCRGRMGGQDLPLGRLPEETQWYDRWHVYTRLHSVRASPLVNTGHTDFSLVAFMFRALTQSIQTGSANTFIPFSLTRTSSAMTAPSTAM